MSERCLNQEQERFLLAISRGNVTTAGLMASLKLETKKFQTISGYLIDHKYIERLKRGEYKLLALGESYITTYLEPALVVSFEDSKVQEFLSQFPEPYMGLLRLTLACCLAKKSKLFKAYKAGFPATLAVGEAGIGKSPTGHTVAWLQGKDPEDVTIDAGLLTKGEIGGRLERDPNHKGKWRLNPSYWQKQDYAQIEDIDKILSKDVSGIIRVIAFAERSFIREGEKISNLVVPFMTMNVKGKQGQAALDQITKEMEIPFVKRNNILFYNPYKGYLKDSSKFFRRVLGETADKKVPVLNLNVPVITELSDLEFDLIARLIRDGMLPEKDNSHCDKRGVGIEVLAYHALTGNKDITLATYQIVRDRLQCLESLGLTRPGWRSWYNREWLEYVEKVDPEQAPIIRAAIKRQEELEASIPHIDLPGKEHDEKVDLANRHSDMLDDLREMRDLLDFPLTRIKGKETVNLSETKLKELCKRHKRNNKGLRNKVVIEITTLKEVTEDNVRIGKLMVDDLRKKVIDVKRVFVGDIQRLVKPVIDDDPERRETAKNEMRFLRAELNQNELMQKVKAELEYIRQRDAKVKIGHPKRIILDLNRGKADVTKRAIETLRAKSAPLSNWLGIRIKRPKKDYPLRVLENDLANAKVQASPMLFEFKKDAETYIKKFETRILGGDEKRPAEPEPDEPQDDLDFGGGGIEGRDL